LLQWEVKAFQKLGLSELYAVLQLRQNAFVVEQHCAYLDADGIDDQCQHVLGKHTDGTLLAYARVVPAGIRFEVPAIGRVITEQSIRKQGFGVPLMHVAIQACRQQYPGQAIGISAQAQLEKFYRSVGFVPTGEQYQEDGIPHISMRLAPETN
jgi:ElaA protein